MTSLPVMAANSTVELDPQDAFLKELATYMAFKVEAFIAKYWFPILIPLGLLGNTLSFLVMVKPNNRKVSTCIYMAAISLGDNLMMCIGIHDYCISVMNTHGWHVVECKMSAFLAFFTLQCVTYLILVMTIDKFVAIKWPHRAATYSTPKRAKVIIVATITLVAMYNMPHFFITAVEKGNCYGYSIKSIATKIYSWFTIVLNGIIPFTLLIHMNYVIVKTVRKSRKMFTSNVEIEGTATRQKTMKNAGESINDYVATSYHIIFDSGSYNLYQIYLCGFCECRDPF